MRSTESMRSRTSFWKPFITESTTISAATPRAMPAIEIAEMKEINALRRRARRPAARIAQPMRASKGRFKPRLDRRCGGRPVMSYERADSIEALGSYS